MSHRTIEFKTAEDMVAHVLARPEDKTNYKLVVNVREEWDDPEAGGTWMARVDNVEWGPERDKFFKDNVRPAEHKVTTRYLMEVGDSWNWTCINLSADLGAAVEAVWPKKQSKYGNCMELSGHRTLAGVLKLLGKSDIGKQVADAMAKAEEARADQCRADVLAQIERLARDLAEYVEKNGGEVGVVTVTIRPGAISFHDVEGAVVKRIPLVEKEAEA